MMFDVDRDRFMEIEGVQFTKRTWISACRSYICFEVMLRDQVIERVGYPCTVTEIEIGTIRIRTRLGYECDYQVKCIDEDNLMILEDLLKDDYEALVVTAMMNGLRDTYSEEQIETMAQVLMYVKAAHPQHAKVPLYEATYRDECGWNVCTCKADKLLRILATHKYVKYTTALSGPASL